jgi:hypothetical protein
VLASRQSGLTVTVAMFGSTTVGCTMASAIPEGSVGDKSPKSKQRDQKQKDAAKVKDKAKKDADAAASRPPVKK